jgi:hypothetical protein
MEQEPYEFRSLASGIKGYGVDRPGNAGNLDCAVAENDVGNVPQVRLSSLHKSLLESIKRVRSRSVLR